VGCSPAVTDVPEFIQTLGRVVRGGSAVDPALVRELVAGRRAGDPLDALSSREREVLALMAEGMSNGGIARQLWVTEATVEKHVHSILLKLALPDGDDVNRRVMAVLAFLRGRFTRLSPQHQLRSARTSAPAYRLPGRRVACLS
jgi:DNA-binding NarL/FixJ family response regulator